MGYRLGAEERFAPRDLTNLVPTYDPAYAFRTTDKLTQFAREAAERQAESDRILSEEIIKGPIKAYQAQADRNRAAAESDQAMRLRDTAGRLTEEQIGSAKQQRELSQKYGERKAEAEIGAYENQMNAAQQQIKNAQIEGKRLEDEAAFMAQPASKAGFKDALPEDTVQTYQLRAGVQGTQEDRELRRAQIEATKVRQQIDEENAKVNRRVAQLGINEQERSNRVRDLRSRLSMAGDDIEATQALANELMKTATISEVQEAFSDIKKNAMQARVVADELQKRDSTYQSVVNKQMEASDAAGQLNSIVAELRDAQERYKDGKTPWSEDANDAMTTIQTTLRSMGYEAQAKSLDSVVNVGLDMTTPKGQRANEAVNKLMRSLSKTYGAKYGAYGNQYQNYSQMLLNYSYGGQNNATGQGPYAQQPAAIPTVPLPTRAGPNFFNNVPQYAPQPAQPQTQNALQQPMVPPQQPGIQRTNAPMPLQAPAAPNMTPAPAPQRFAPSTFKTKQRAAQQ
jgi:hypothetical protein